MILTQYYPATASMERLVEMIEAKPTIFYPEPTSGYLTEGCVVFEDVWMDYDGEEGEHLISEKK